MVGKLCSRMWGHQSPSSHPACFGGTRTPTWCDWVRRNHFEWNTFQRCSCADYSVPVECHYRLKNKRCLYQYIICQSSLSAWASDTYDEWVFGCCWPSSSSSSCLMCCKRSRPFHLCTCPAKPSPLQHQQNYKWLLIIVICYMFTGFSPGDDNRSW